jgi:hypothetical protein
VQLYRDGHASVTEQVEVALGETKRVSRASLLPINGDSAPPPQRVQAKPQIGWYGLLTLDAANPSETPQQYDADRSKAEGGSIGLRGGRRFTRVVGAELMLEFSRARGEECPKVPMPAECTEEDYALDAARFGPNLRLSTVGEVIRFSSAIGFGVVSHRYVQPDEESEGADGYFHLELGGQMNLGHVLLGLDISVTVDGVSRLKDDSDVAIYAKDSVTMVGVGLRGGFSQWRPSR